MTFDDIRAELMRPEAYDVELHLDDRRSRLASPLVKITIGSRSCSVEAAGLLKMLSYLPDGVGNNGIEVRWSHWWCLLSTFFRDAASPS